MGVRGLGGAFQKCTRWELVTGKDDENLLIKSKNGLPTRAVSHSIRRLSGLLCLSLARAIYSRSCNLADLYRVEIERGG